MNRSELWQGVITKDDEERYAAAGFGQSVGIGERPALLIIDVQYRTTGSSPKPFFEAVEEYRTSCGEAAWRAVERIKPILELFRERNLPVLYPHVAPKENYDSGRLGAKIPAIMDIAKQGYNFVKEVAPVDGDILLPKKHPSAFFGTALVSHLVDLGVDTLILTGCTTSGCVRATAVDAFAYNFRVLIPHDAVYDRTETVHKANLFDLSQKYVDLVDADETVELIQKIRSADTQPKP